MAPFLCSICQELHRLDKLRCLPCGHTFCAICVTGCINITAQPANIRGRPPRPRLPTCPSCRKEFKGTDPHPIYLDYGDLETSAKTCHTDAVHQRMQTATRVINLVEQDLRHQTVQKAALEMEKVVELSDGQQECLLGLLATVAARWRGMLPVFSTVAEQRNQLLLLQKQLRQTELERDTAAAATSHAERIATNAVQTTEQVHKALQTARAEVETLQRAAEHSNEAHKEALAEKQKRIDWLYGSLNAFKAKVAKQKAEIEQLRQKVQEIDALREVAESQLVDLEVGHGRVEPESLVVLPDDSRDFDLSGSQATFERLPGNARKRKGSEDDLARLDAEQASDTDDPSQRAAPAPPKEVSKPAKPKAPIFSSDWQLPSAQVKQKGAQRTLQRSTSANISFPLALDRNGKPSKPVQVGSRKRMRGDS